MDFPSALQAGSTKTESAVAGFAVDTGPDFAARDARKIEASPSAVDISSRLSEVGRHAAFPSIVAPDAVVRRSVVVAVASAIQIRGVPPSSRVYASLAASGDRAASVSFDAVIVRRVSNGAAESEREYSSPLPSR